MTQASLVQPPRLAAWLLDLFVPKKQAESIPGDLFEEFSNLASRSGVVSARSWYWRYSLKTIAHLIVDGLYNAPWSTAAVVLGGFFLWRFVCGLPERAIFAVLQRYRVFDHHFDTYVFFASTGIVIGQLLASFFVGCMVALAAKGREMITTMTLSLVHTVLLGTAISVWVVRGQFWGFGILPWQFAIQVTIVIGGAVVRRTRSAVEHRPARA